MPDRDSQDEILPVPPSILRRYDDLRYIDRGGMGAVFRAYDPTLHRHVALKLVLPKNGDSTLSQRMRREVDVLSRVNHPNVVRLYDFIEEDGVMCLVMEYVEGRTLADILDTALPTARRAVEIVLDIVEAMAATQALGVFHRDVKPTNVVIADDGLVKLLDFGAVSRTSHRAGTFRTERNLAVGTPPYMAPEVFLGEPWDDRADVYQLGVVLYELLTGERPFDVRSVETIAAMACRSKTPRVVPPSRLSKGADCILDNLVLEMLDWRAERRPARLEIVRRRLQRWLRGGSVPRAMVRRPTETVSGVRRFGLSRYALLILLLVLSTVTLQGFRWTVTKQRFADWCNDVRVRPSATAVEVRGTDGLIDGVTLTVLERASRRIVERRSLGGEVGPVDLRVDSLTPATGYQLSVATGDLEWEVPFETPALPDLAGAFACASHGTLYIDADTPKVAGYSVEVRTYDGTWRGRRPLVGHAPWIVQNLPAPSPGGYRWTLLHGERSLFSGTAPERPEAVPSCRTPWTVDGATTTTCSWPTADPLWLDRGFVVTDAFGAVTHYDVDDRPSSGDGAVTVRIGWCVVPRFQPPTKAGRSIGGLVRLADGRLLVAVQETSALALYCFDVERRRRSWSDVRNEDGVDDLGPREWVARFPELTAFHPRERGVVVGSRVTLFGGVTRPEAVVIDMPRRTLVRRVTDMVGAAGDWDYDNPDAVALHEGPPGAPAFRRRWWYGAAPTAVGDRVFALVAGGNGTSIEYATRMVSFATTSDGPVQAVALSCVPHRQSFTVDRSSTLWACSSAGFVAIAGASVTPYPWSAVDVAQPPGYPASAPLPADEGYTLMKLAYLGRTTHSMFDFAGPKRVSLLDWRPGGTASVRVADAGPAYSATGVQMAALYGAERSGRNVVAWAHDRVIVVDTESGRCGQVVDGTSWFCRCSASPDGWLVAATMAGEFYVLPQRFVLALGGRDPAPVTLAGVIDRMAP